MSKCPACGAYGFVALPYPEESKCPNCGSRFYGSDKAVRRSDELTCNHCDYVWTYRGKSAYYATCPRCKSSVRVKR